MMNYIIWNADPEIFTIPIPFFDTELTLRWYGLLFALGFIISQQILYYIYRKEGKPEKDVDTLTIYMVIATILGARLGHVIFYQPELLWTNPASVILPFEFNPTFKFTGLQGLASHGGAIGILLALWIYSRKKKPGQNYFQVLDRIVILVALTGALIRLGNFYNAEILGMPTHSNYGIVFANDISEALTRTEPVDRVSFVPVDSTANEMGYQPAKMLVEFKPDSSAQVGDLHRAARRILSFQASREHFDSTEELPTKLVKDENGVYSAIVFMYLIPRHPAQLYESISCLLLFAFLFWRWYTKKEKLPAGQLFGIFLVVCFGLRFFYEFLKENQVGFEEGMVLNMGQILSIPLVLAGLIILILSNRKKTLQTPE